MKQVSLIIPKDQNPEEAHLFIGIVYLASYLDERGIPVKIYDEQRDEASKNMKEIIDKSFLVGFTVMTSQLKSARDLSKIIKKKGIPIIWGGIHPTLFPEQCLKEKYVDYVSYDEGEETLFELAKSLREGKPRIEDIKGIHFKKGNKMIRNPEQPYIDLNGVSPHWQLINLDNYEDERFIGTKTALNGTLIHTGRGCPYVCSFCINTLLNKRHWRSLSYGTPVLSLHINPDGVFRHDFGYHCRSRYDELKKKFKLLTKTEKQASFRREAERFIKENHEVGRISAEFDRLIRTLEDRK